MNSIEQRQQALEVMSKSRYWKEMYSDNYSSPEELYCQIEGCSTETFAEELWETPQGFSIRVCGEHYKKQ